MKEDKKDNTQPEIVKTPASQDERRDDKGQFIKGYSGNPEGGAKGSHHHLVQVRELALQALALLNKDSEKENWLLELAKKDPRTLAMILAKTMPKDIKADVTVSSSDPKLSNEELLARCKAITDGLKRPQKARRDN